jgi:hypothetical protein
MALFKNNPEKTVQRDISAGAANRERLSTQLADTEQAIARHTAAAKQAALTSNEAELDRAEVSLRAAQDRSKTLKAALADVEQELEALERTKAEIADRKPRAETAAEVELVVRKMAEAGAEFDALAARLSEYTRRAVPWLWNAFEHGTDHGSVMTFMKYTGPQQMIWFDAKEADCYGFTLYPPEIIKRGKRPGEIAPCVREAILGAGRR